MKLRDRVVWQSASLLLAYPDEQHTQRLDTVEQLLDHIRGKAAGRLQTPDYLPVVLEFAATVDPEAGRRLLVEHRVPIDVLAQVLTEADSPYAHTIAAVCATLPQATDQQVRRAQRLARSGPPAEAVGLEPFTLTVPPRRASAGA